MEMKKEYYTEIWSIDVTSDEAEAYTARDNEVIVADVSSRVSLLPRLSDNLPVIFRQCLSNFKTQNK